LSVDVPSGERRIIVNIDFMKSNEVAVTAPPSGVVDLSCSGRGSPMAFFNTIFRRNAYLDLHVMTEAERASWEAAQLRVPKPRNLGDKGVH
jgi:hypothetical protein